MSWRERGLNLRAPFGNSRGPRVIANSSTIATPTWIVIGCDIAANKCALSSTTRNISSIELQTEIWAEFLEFDDS